MRNNITTLLILVFVNDHNFHLTLTKQNKQRRKQQNREKKVTRENLLQGEKKTRTSIPFEISLPLVKIWIYKDCVMYEKDKSISQLYIIIPTLFAITSN